MRVAARGLVLVFLASAQAADLKLDALRTALVAMRGNPPAGAGHRGATPQLTAAKRLFRDWIESRLPVTDAGPLNEALEKAGLLCSWSKATAPECPEWFQQGFVSPVRVVTVAGGVMVVTAGVGIECGYDESLYIYRRSGARVASGEQLDYSSEKRYRPRSFVELVVSPDGRYLAATGQQDWCESNLREAYHQIYSLETGGLLADEWSDGFEPQDIRARFEGDGSLLIEFMREHLLTAPYRVVYHYQLSSKGVKRIDPVAFGPKAFVAEWLTRDWAEMARWSEVPGVLQVWHDQKLVSGSEAETKACAGPLKGAWQVGFDPAGVYYLVRWDKGSDRFQMVSAGRRPSPNCKEDDPFVDNTDRSLFPPVQGRLLLFGDQLQPEATSLHLHHGNVERLH